MKYFEIPITIPKTLYTDTSGVVRGDAKIPKGNYNLYLNIPLGLASQFKWFLEKTLKTVMTVGDSYIIINKIEDIDTNTLKINLDIGAPPLLAVLGVIAGVGLITSYVLIRVERVVKIAYPLAIGVGSIILIRTFRVPLVALAKKAVAK